LILEAEEEEGGEEAEEGREEERGLPLQHINLHELSAGQIAQILNRGR
jgi:hypothetical protein